MFQAGLLCCVIVCRERTSWCEEMKIITSVGLLDILYSWCVIFSLIFLKQNVVSLLRSGHVGTARGEKTGAVDAVPEQGEGDVRQVLTIKLYQVSGQVAQRSVLEAVALSVFLLETRHEKFLWSFYLMNCFR